MLITNWSLPLVLVLSSDGSPTPTREIHFDLIEMIAEPMGVGRAAFFGRESVRTYADGEGYLSTVRFFHQSGTFDIGREWFAYSFSSWSKPSWIRLLFCAKYDSRFLALDLNILGVRVQGLTGFTRDVLQEWIPTTALSVLFRKDVYFGHRIGLEFLRRQRIPGPFLEEASWESPTIIFYLPRRAWKLSLGMIGVNYTAAL